jgi:hypothetical protein
MTVAELALSAHHLPIRRGSIMQLFRLCSPVLPLALALACASPTESGSSSLEGRWVASAEKGSPSGWYQRSITFENSGSFISEVRSYGIYGGQPRDELSGYQRTEGTYTTEGDRLLFHPTRLVSWDRFYGVDSPERISEPYPYGTIFDDARYEMLGPLLTLHFTIYPADAPEPTVVVFARVP